LCASGMGARREADRRMAQISEKCDISEEPSYKPLERRGEAIYAEMYERGSPLGLLSEIKECFEGAIAAAEGDGLAAEAARLRARLDHIVAVYRRQFS